MIERGISLRVLAADVHFDAGYLSKIRSGCRTPSAELVRKLDETLGAHGELIALASTARGRIDGPSSVERARPQPGVPNKEDDDMERRRLLQALAALGITASPAVEALQHIHGGVDRALGRSEDSQLDEWEETVAEYGYSYLLLPPQQLLRDLAVDLVAVQQITARRGDDRLFGSWCRVTSGLSLLMAKTLCNLGEPHMARQWWVTAQHAADSSGDTNLSLWVGEERLIHGLYEGRPVTVLLRKANETLELSAGTPCRGLAALHATRAQLLALEGRAPEAEANLRACEEISSALPASATDVRSVDGWAEDRVHYTAAWVHAYAGDRARLDTSVADALAILPADNPRTSTQLTLLRAAGHVRAGDVTEGVRLAHTVYEAQPREHRTTMVNSLARKVTQAVPARRRADPGVADYVELVGSGSRKSIA
ncbi:helix-turn-helix transcriptional regulator [Actinomadura sp. WMMB 499]|uniref:helix-turn-helix domain-containing protein n=1 Tax=Actinomadura sp. WMMB 499 TaxID=1219491 RepID=UPI001245D312|nr:helix-turn-helix transcriptional regulator [Actinomadura sp. WMMB 499]QFG22354.1 helix-turn-helix transcriptional regulator [Actinomadura sp. WMMB 499]